MDYSNYLAVPASLLFIKSIGGLAALHNHAIPMLDWAQDMLVKAFKTEALPAPKNMGAPYMRIIG